MNTEYPMDHQPSVLLSGLRFMHNCQVVNISKVPIPCSLRQRQKVYIIGSRTIIRKVLIEAQKSHMYS